MNRNVSFRRRLTIFLSFLFILGIFFLSSSEEASAQTCPYQTVTSCSFDPENGCQPSYGTGTVNCTFDTNTCNSSGGRYCWHNGYFFNAYLGCNYSTNTCVVQYNAQVNGPSNCGCNGGSTTGGGGTGGGTGGGGSCDCNGCSWSCYDTDQSSATIECAQVSDCDGDPDGTEYSCRQNCCATSCSPSCSCTPSCVNPSGLTFTSPAANSTIQPGTILRWNLNSWGADSNASSCNNNSCQYQSDSGQGRYQLYVAGTNITQYCQGYLGSGAGAYVTSNQCTLTTPPTSWPGTVQNITVRASNNCGNTEVSRSFTWAVNQRPFCSNLAVSSVQGRWANGLYGVRNTEQVTMTVNAGENDPYGSPRFLQLCYAIRNQPLAFYQAAGGAAWTCIGQSTNSSTYNVSTTFASMEASYAPSIAYTGSVTQHGFVVVTNVGDNMSNNICTTNIGWNNGAGAYRPNYPPDTCNGGTCVLNIHNNAPEIGGLTVGTPPGTWIGTPEDSDNGLSCVDNNPFTYQAYVTDPDGSADIDRIDFQLGTAAQLADANNDNVLDNAGVERNLPLRVIFARRWEADGNQEFANGTFFIRDTQVISNNSTTRRCYDQSRGTHLIDPTGWDTSNPAISRNARSTTPYTVWCYGYDGHSWDDVTPLLNQNLNGVSVDVYYLRNDLEVYGEGYGARLKGDTVNWQNASYVAYERGTGTRAFVQYKVEYLKDGTVDRWSGEYKNSWMVLDQLGKDDSTENFPGEYMADDQFANSMHIFGDTRIDLTAPTVTMNAPNPISASRIQVPWFATDTRSGLNRVYGEANSTANGAPADIYYQPGNIAYNITQHPPATTPPPTASPFLWNKALSGTSDSFAETIDVGDNDEGNLHFDTYAQDNACNLGQATTSLGLATPWIMTKGGLLYTEGAPNVDVKSLSKAGYPNPDPLSPAFTNYPFNINKWEVGLSSELLATGAPLVAAAFEDTNLTGSFSLANYADNNDKLWYQNFKNEVAAQMAKKPDEYNYVTGVSGLLSKSSSLITSGGVDCSDPNKLCIVESPQLSIVDLSSPFTCDRKTAFIIEGDLTINADIVTDTNRNGCLFIVQGDVTIGSSSYKSGGVGYPEYDLVEGFIISDGSITILEDTDGTASGYRDGLKIRGGILGFGDAVPPMDSSLIFERSLKLLDNLNYPSVVIHHDPRYFKIAEEIMGGDNETYKTEVGFKPEE